MLDEEVLITNMSAEFSEASAATFHMALFLYWLMCPGFNNTLKLLFVVVVLAIFICGEVVQ